MRLTKLVSAACLILATPATCFAESFKQDDFFKANSSPNASGAFARTAGNIAETNQAIEARRLIDIANAKIEKDPNNNKYYAARAQCFADLGEITKALADINRAIDLNAHDQSYFAFRGGVYSRLKNYSLALADLDTALQIGPPTAKLYIARSGVLDGLKRFRDSLRDADSAIKIDPNWAEAYGSRGLSKFYLHDISGANADCAKAESLDPRNGAAIELRAFLNRNTSNQR